MGEGGGGCQSEEYVKGRRMGNYISSIFKIVSRESQSNACGFSISHTLIYLGRWD